MKESLIEMQIRLEAEKEGWLVYKFTSNERGVPDRLFLRNGKAVFLEAKAPGKKPRSLQDWQLKRIRKAGFKAACVDNLEDALEVLFSA